MSDLSSTEKLKFEKIFGMDSGYVMDFSNKSFSEFVMENVEIEIFDSKYNYASNSKANRLRKFWQIESNAVVGELLLALLEYWVTDKQIKDLAITPEEQILYDACLKIVERLREENSKHHRRNIWSNSDQKRPLKVFISYASQDRPTVRKLSQRLVTEGWIDAWLDEAKLLPGQDWRIRIEEAVETSDIVIICLSKNSVSKEGYVQKELRYAREIALEKPDDTIFLIPLRLDDCNIPRGLRFYQWADYFGSKKDDTYFALLESLKLRYAQMQKTVGIENASTISKVIPTQQEKQRFRIMVTGGKVISKIVEKLAFDVGYQVILRGHTLMNNGTRGVDQFSAIGAFKACREKNILANDEIQVFRPKEGQIPDFDIGKLEIIGQTYDERRNYVIDNSDAIIILSGGYGTRGAADYTLSVGKPLIPIGIGDSTEVAVEFWQSMMEGLIGEIGRDDLKKIGGNYNKERIAINAVILAEILVRNRK